MYTHTCTDCCFRPVLVTPAACGAVCFVGRPQVGQENGNSLQALQSILRAEGVGGLFVGGREQLIREIPFNAIQFTVYEVSQVIKLQGC